MASKQSKKGKNPHIVDAWLDKLGYYRKNIAFDETCLFRAIAEQLFSSQLQHEKVRVACIEYGKENHCEFQILFPLIEDWIDHLDKLANHMVVCGYIEILIISKLYKHDVVLFDGINHKVTNLTEADHKDQLLLCKMSEDHYDSVYKRDYIAAAGFCQSIIYNIVYENVLQVPNVQDIVHTMLYGKNPDGIYSTEDIIPKLQYDMDDSDESCATESSQKKNDADLLHLPFSSWAPFPFKVAKALDPTIYRNIEYDTWTEMRKELRLGDWYYGDNNLILGTRCILSIENTTFSCYLQEFLSESKKCVVYITSLAEKRIVDYNNLSPEADAKPWPLPYRFCKNTLPSPLPENVEKENKTLNKKKNKKRNNKNSNENTLSLNLNIESPTEKNVSLYEGCPLQIQESPKKQSTPEPVSTDTFDQIVTQTVTEVQQNYEDNWSDPFTPESSLWNPISVATNSNAYSTPKIVIPATPETPYSTDPFFYYHPNENYNNCNPWSDYPNDQVVQQNVQVVETDNNIQQSESYNYVYCNDSRMSGYSNTPTTILTPVPENQMYPTPMTPTSPFVEMFPPPPYGQPMSPLVYGAPTPENPTGEMIPSPIPLTLYSPPIPYMYVQTPTPTWYPHGINSQGFIFPTTTSPQNIGRRF